MKASTLDAANVRRKECVNSLRREKMAEVKGLTRLEAELERARAVYASTTRATQQVRNIGCYICFRLPPCLSLCTDAPPDKANQVHALGKFSQTLTLA